jgi:hypothetical protein
VDDFLGAKSRNHWRMAQVAYENGRKILDAQGGDTPTEWMCWGIEIEIARGNWDIALRDAKYVTFPHNFAWLLTGVKSNSIIAKPYLWTPTLQMP